MMGARLFLPPPGSRSLGWMVRAGQDFPESAEKNLNEWDTTLLWEKSPSQSSTRGFLRYEDSTFGREDLVTNLSG